MRSVIIVGGGVSGLATAHFLRVTGGDDVEVTVLEAETASGGKIRTRLLAGYAVDTGPDAFLSRSAPLRTLLAQLGLTEEVVGPAASGAFIWSRKKLRPLPAGATFGVPEKVWPLVRTGLISPLGALRAAADVLLPATKLADDPTVEQVVAPRLGREVFDRMVEPLLGGVHAGTATELSAHSSVPEIEAMVRGKRSLILSMGRSKKAKRSAVTPAGAKPVAPLVSLRGGLGRLTGALASALGADVHTGVDVTGVYKQGDGYEVRAGSRSWRADEVVLATPAPVSSRLLAQFDPALAGLLDQIGYVGVANVTFALPAADLPPLPAGTGFLVPPIEGEFIVGCTWLSAKWPHLVNDEVVLIRAMVGRAGDDRWATLSDPELVAWIRSDLERMTGIPAEIAAVDTIVQRWPAAMPQYTVGHADRLAVLDHRLAEHPGLHVVGAAYRGVGLAGCVAAAQTLAARICDSPAGRVPIADPATAIAPAPGAAPVSEGASA
ncbi:MAG: protoporphyrinogen oxidase [Candidatus Nanopelagicales bacterium]